MTAAAAPERSLEYLARWVATPHQSSRRGAAIRWVVLHADVSPREASTVAWIANPASQVSYHALIHRDGTVTRFVEDRLAAWACGKSQWGGVVGLNRHSLSLAFANRHDSKEPLSKAQRDTARRVIAVWRAAHPIEAVLTHAMISPGRKTDPQRIPDFSISQFG